MPSKLSVLEVSQKTSKTIGQALVMISYQNSEIYASVALFVLVKIVCAVVRSHCFSMYDKKPLASIPENETEDETVKWVPKKKHEVLKAKYKCLKKLFQIYDASVIGILPENYPETYEEPHRSYRRKRSHRTKNDACAGTTEACSGDVFPTEPSPAVAVIRDFNLQKYCSTQDSKTTLNSTTKTEKYDKSTQESKEDVSTEFINSDRESECIQTSDPHPIPYFVLDERRRPTRFQSFINRILGLKPESNYNVSPITHVYAMSDNNISNRYERRTRRGLRFRRRRARKVNSEIALRDVRSPMILSYVQSIQRSCLMDTTPRQCPIPGCRMMSYGIINYNDHLNLCHFSDRKFVCHYCHEGFASEYDKILHENEHIGITKIAANLPTAPSISGESGKTASITQTDPELSKCDVPDEKLKIVSFCDNNSRSEGKLQSSVDLRKTCRKFGSSFDSDRTSNFLRGNQVTCRFCGEKFDFRRQLSLHVDLEHRVHDKFSKFHSCHGIINKPAKTAEISSEDGRINVQTFAPVPSQSVNSDVSRKSMESDASAKIVYYTSLESMVRKPSVVGSLVHKIRSYKWEPGTKVIRV